MAAPNPFSLARHNRFDELKKILVDRAIDVNQRDRKDNTLLLVACQNGISALTLNQSLDTTFISSRMLVDFHHIRISYSSFIYVAFLPYTQACVELQNY